MTQQTMAMEEDQQVNNKKIDLTRGEIKPLRHFKI